MKIRFDECLSPKLARAVVAVFPEYEISHVRDDNPAGTTDPDWMIKFAAQGGQVMVSADLGIRNRPNLLQALETTGLVSFFLHQNWMTHKHIQAAYLLKWWPVLMRHARDAQPGGSWRVPFVFNYTELEVLWHPGGFGGSG